MPSVRFGCTFLSAGSDGWIELISASACRFDRPHLLDYPGWVRRDRVTSSSLVSVGFDGATNQLEIEFRSGDVYRYLVPRRIHLELMAAESIGRHFVTRIRPVYRGWKVNDGS